MLSSKHKINKYLPPIHAILGKKNTVKMSNLTSFIKTHRAKIIILLIIFLGLILRLICINKPTGLWFDEIYCNYLASQSMPFNFFDKLYSEDFHAPLYFIFLHFWIKMFGSTDIILRLFSCICSLMTIPIFYLLGKKIHSKKLGVICAATIAVNSILIYYSQEVKFYSLLFLISSVALLFLIKYKQNPNKSNSIGLILSNTALLYTYTLAPIYVFTIALGYIIYLIKTDKNAIKAFLKLQLIIITLYLPYLPFIIHQHNIISSFFIDLAEVFYFSMPNVLTTIQMWFSPVIFNLSNGVPIALKPNIIMTVPFIIYAVIPTLICLLGLYKTIEKKGFYAALLLMNLGFIFIVFVSAVFHMFAFIPRFILIAMPAVLLFSIYGLFQIKNEKLTKTLVTMYLIINLFYLAIVPYSAPRLNRNEGYNSVAKMLKKENISKKDIICMPFAGKFLTRYSNLNILNLDFGKLYIRNQNNSLEMILDKNLIKNLNKRNAREKLRTYIFSKNIPPAFNEYLHKNIYNKLEKNHYFVLVINTNYYFNYKDLESMKSNNARYNIIALHHILYSKMVLHIADFGFKNFKVVKIAKSPGDIWVMILFKKI